MKKAWLVAIHEFQSAIKRIGFWLITFGLPLLYSLALGLTAYQLPFSTRANRIGWVDEASLLTLPQPPEASWVHLASRDDARKRMIPDHISTVIVIPSDYVNHGGLVIFTTQRPSLFQPPGLMITPLFCKWIQRNLLVGVEPNRVEQVLDPVREGRIEMISTQPMAQNIAQISGANLILSIGLSFLLFFSIALTGGYLVQGVADEKENRVFEIVLSSLSPMQLLTGKLLGLGAVGLLQTFLWASLGLLSALFFHLPISMGVTLLLWGLLFFILGYTLLGSLLLGVGSLGANQREATQYSALFSVLACIPMFSLTSLIATPHSFGAHLLSLFPLTAPVTMLLRLGLDPAGISAGEIVASLFVLFLSIVVSLHVSAKLFRMGLLLYGKQLTLKELWLCVKS